MDKYHYQYHLLESERKIGRSEWQQIGHELKHSWLKIGKLDDQSKMWKD